MYEAPPNTPGERHRAAKLLWEARNEFGRISSTDRQIIRCASLGTLANFNTQKLQDHYYRARQSEQIAIESDEELPIHTDRPVPDAIADPRIIHWLLTTKTIEPLLNPRGVRIFCARFDSLIDLRTCVLSRPLWLVRCTMLAGIDLLGAQCSLIGLSGSLVCQGSMEGSQRTCAIRADGLRADIVFLRNGFRSFGEVRLVGSYIKDNLECDEGIFVSTEDNTAIRASGIDVKGTLFLRRIAHVGGTIDLTRARIGYLVDYNDPDTNSQCDILLSDCRYGAIHTWPSLNAQDRLRWLSRHDDIVRSWYDNPKSEYTPDPHPYRWLAEIMKKQGHEDEARTVLRVCAERRMSGLAERARRDVESNPTTYCGLLAIAWFIAGACAWLSGLVGTVGTWATSRYSR